MPSWNSLQDVLRDRVDSGFIKCYPLGDVTDPISLSYNELYSQAQHNSAKIRSIPGFKERHPILLHLDSFLDSIVWFWSVLLASGMPVILSTNVNHSHDHLKGLAVLLENPLCITTNKLISIFDTAQGIRLHTIKDLKRRETSFQEAVCHFQYGGGSATAMLMLTSGSTGLPKAVRLSHEQILAAVAGKAAVRPLAESLPFFNWIGLDHVASLVEIHIQALWLGIDQVHSHAADVVASPTTFLSILHRHRVSKTFAPNFFLAKLVSALQDEEEYRDWDLSNLTMLASGGEDNDIDTCLAASSLLHKYGAPLNIITSGFGMTETCAGAIFNLDCPAYDMKYSRTVASLGTCMDGIEMRITVPGQDLQLALLNVPGNLEVRGSVVFDGYYRNPDATAEAFTSDGWFRTGDQGMIDSQGALSLIGRTKDVVNINGAKFAMSNIQSALERGLSHQVNRLVTFVSRAAHTERVTVAYIPRHCDGQSHDILKIEDSAARICQLQFGASPIIFALRKESIPLLPTSSLGKISRTKMRSLYESGAFSEDIDMHFSQVRQFREQRLAAEINRDISNTEALLIGVLTDLQRVGSAAISVQTSIFELGFSSIDVVRLKLRIERLFGINVPVTTLLRHPSPSSLAKALGPDCHDSSSGAMADSGYDPVVAFNVTGSKSPLWLVHPGIGEVLVFVGLAQYMADDDRPVYALRARGFEPGQKRFESIEETVDTYITAIRRRQPRGPYAIAGYSYGAMLAFEITKKLEAADGAGAVQFLGSFNLPPYIKARMRQLVWNNCLLHLTHFLGLTTEAEAERIEASEFQDMSQDHALNYILDIANADRMGELGLDKAGLSRWTDVAYDLPRMATDYDPQGDVAVLDVFHAIPLKAAAPNREDWVKNHLSKWQDFCRSKPRFHEVGGAHYTMIGPDHVAAFSATLRSALRARGV